MIIVKTIGDLREHLDQVSQTKKIGFVPTMGALHAGHASMVTRAKRDNDFVIFSIFVNPTQFNEESDYQSYPTELTEDVELLKKLGVDCLFIPEKTTMYPSGYDFSIHPNSKLSCTLEGQLRPGHFTGMLTIVMKFLVLVKPEHAYFGEKDYQQAILVAQMAESFFLPTVIVRCPTKREPSGLPFSSRNANLTESEKATAQRVYTILQKESFSDLPILADKIKMLGVDVEYLEESAQRIFLAMRIGKTRLIDNFLKESAPCLSQP